MRDEQDPGTLDLITGGLHLGYARVSTDAVVFRRRLHQFTGLAAVCA